MAIKIFGILLALFSISFVILSFQDPYFFNFKDLSINFKNIEAKNLIASEINSTSVKSIYKAKVWLRYKDKDIFKDFININKDYNVSANTLEILHKSANSLIFSGNVLYKDKDNVKITSDEIYYYIDDKILKTNVGFNAFLDANLITGKILNYDLKTKILNIKEAKAWLEQR